MTRFGFSNLRFCKVSVHYFCCYFHNFCRLLLEKRRLTSQVGFYYSDLTFKTSKFLIRANICNVTWYPGFLSHSFHIVDLMLRANLAVP